MPTFGTVLACAMSRIPRIRYSLRMQLHAAISGSEENISMGPFLLIKAKAQHNVGQYLDSVSSYRQVRVGPAH